MWKGRFKEDMAQVVLGFNQSLDLDWRMAEHDIEGSLAHVRMLGATGLLPSGEAAKRRGSGRCNVRCVTAPSSLPRPLRMST